MPREAYLAGDQADVEVAVQILEDNPAFAANNGDIPQCVAEQLQRPSSTGRSSAKTSMTRGTGGPK
jgi:hypothetical protein